MFTGIITDVGTLLAVSPQGSTGDRRLRIATAFDTDAVAIGASIACSGCCLTVTAKGRDGAQSWFDADVSGETIAKTTLGDWHQGRRINLERSLKFGDELGGHLVYGHVDGVGRIVGREPEGGSLRLKIETPPDLARFVASKGSVAVDGISLTVNEVDDRVFGVNIIPHTQAETTIGASAVGSRVNLEADMLARYVARLLQREGE